MTRTSISTYGDMWLMKDALEKAGKADRVAVAEALAHDGWRARRNIIRGGELKFDEKGRRVGAGWPSCSGKPASLSRSIRRSSRWPSRSGRRAREPAGSRGRSDGDVVR